MFRQKQTFICFSIFGRRNMTYSTAKSYYESAENTLLQVYKSSLTNEKLQKCRDENSLALMQQLLKRSDIAQNDLTNLNVVHVAGTKGKGSTCAFVESILRRHGYRTALCTSPHLTEVRERIKINGKSIKKDAFSKYFRDIYSKLESTKNDYEIHLPTYFHLLTLVAFHAFIEEKVDVTILEVGLGGAYDCTNVVDSPIVCGITSLGLDHTEILGNTLSDIAWHKSGILKPGVQGFVSPQPNEAMNVIKKQSLNRKAPITIAPNFSKYGKSDLVELGLKGSCQFINASLALQLSKYFIDWKNGNNMRYDNDNSVGFELTKEYIGGLENCKLDGRSQVLEYEGMTFYLDSAHTNESMQCCVEWFKEASTEEESLLGKECTKILLFNVTRDRDASSMLRQLVSCNFQHVYFVPNDGIGDLPLSSMERKNQKQKIKKNQRLWLQFKQKHNKDSLVLDYETSVANSLANTVCLFSQGRDPQLFSLVAKKCKTPPDPVNILPQMNFCNHLQILVTGSLHLVGDFLKISKES